MARSFRYYGKKRGNRRTGSPVLARLGEALFFAVLLLLGCAGLVWMISNLVVPDWRVNHEFVETTCKVLEKRIGEKAGEDGPLYRPEIKIEYEVRGVTYSDWHYDVHWSYSGGRDEAQAELDQFALYDQAKSNRYPCWYDAMDPRVAVVVRESGRWLWLLFTVPVSFMAIGAGGLIYALVHRGKSAERVAAERDFFRVGSGSEYPAIPRGVDMTNSPGTRLPFRLPMATSPGWMLFGSLAICVLLNGVVWTIAAIAIGKHLAGHPDWFLTLFITPFILIGFGAIAIFVWQLLIATGIGPTLVEISDHPFQPGGRYRLFLTQAGRLAVNALRISLVCEEAATYRQGTNTRTESQTVYRQELFCRKDFRIESGEPFETEIELEMPAGAMHSFKAGHNEINWILAVEGDVAKWPGYKRTFPIIVRPADGSIHP